MYLRNGEIFDLDQLHVIGDIQYPIGSLYDVTNHAALDIVELHDTAPPAVTGLQKLVQDGYEQDAEGRWVARWLVVDKTAGEMAAETSAAAVLLESQRAAKNAQINAWRAAANLSSFPHAGRQFACDALSRSDIDGVANNIALFGAFPAGFPGAWKAIDNSLLMLADVAAFKSLYASMTAQGATNFNHAQALKTALAAATTPEAVAAITW